MFPIEVKTPLECMLFLSELKKHCNGHGYMTTFRSFKETYDLLLQIIRLSMNLQRDFRYTIGERLKMEIMDPVHYIYKANGNYKKEFIEKARKEWLSSNYR